MVFMCIIHKNAMILISMIQPQENSPVKQQKHFNTYEKSDYYCCNPASDFPAEV